MRTLLASILVLLTSNVACDAPGPTSSGTGVPHDRPESISSRALDLPGSAWGPCKGGPGGQCSAGLFCVDDQQSSVCLPACVESACPQVPVGLCDSPVVPACQADGVCAVACVNDGDCLAGMTCAEFGLCAHPA